MRQSGFFLLFVWLSFFNSILTAPRCPRGWEPIGCNNEWKCVIPMSEFESEKLCIKKGGIPSVSACLSRGKSKVKESHDRVCIKDLKNGDLGFAKNLKQAIAAQERKEKEMAEKENNPFSEEDV